ncbi:MAG: response regulator, partial [Nitrospiraceae bacterium]|nr:response regulator [Nitrospiraceae bacterium]
MDKGSILIIDDEEIIRDSCRRVLEPEGYAVRTAGSGGEGLAVLAGVSVDLVLTDLKMPGMSGIEVLVSIREN